MNLDQQKAHLTPLNEQHRSAGILLHLTSLPSPFGIGDFGPAAYHWIDTLADSGQKWWQFLPLAPTGWGFSPYSPLSSFAINPLLVSPEELQAAGLLSYDDCGGATFPAERVEYEAVQQFKRRLLQVAFDRLRGGAAAHLQEPMQQFCAEEAGWLEDFALFMTLKQRFGGSPYYDWPRELARHEPGAIAAAHREHAEELEYYRFEQFITRRQAQSLVEHARRRGVRLIADIPFFVGADSADAWSRPDLFLLDENHRPRVVAGVPPDYFSPTGQKWGNPVYDWDRHRAEDYAWWTERVRGRLTYVDLLRIDHFRGFVAAWHVPANAPTAEGGQWMPGPGADLFEHFRRALGGLPFLAEDLGLITKEVEQLRDKFGLPGMRILQFAFEGKLESPFLPHNYPVNTVVYTGTHDNDTTRGWYRTLPDDQAEFMLVYLKRNSIRDDEIAWVLMELALESRAALAIFPLQDVLNLGPEARMNMPGVAEGNWSWRLPNFDWVREPFGRLRELTQRCGR